MAKFGTKSMNQLVSCDQDIRHYMVQDIVVAGGDTLYPGFNRRLKDELEAELKEHDETLAGSLSFHVSDDRLFEAWKGASTLYQLDSFKS